MHSQQMTFSNILDENKIQHKTLGFVQLVKCSLFSPFSLSIFISLSFKQYRGYDFHLRPINHVKGDSLPTISTKRTCLAHNGCDLKCLFIYYNFYPTRQNTKNGKIRQ